MRSTPSGIAAAFAILLWQAPAAAQSWPICLDGEIPTPEAYRSLAEAAAVFREAGPYSATWTIQPGLGDAPEPDAADTRRWRTIYVEALRAGLPPSQGRREAGDAEAPGGCRVLAVRVEPDGRPAVPSLWHMGGAHFREGGVEIDAAGAFWVRVAAALNVPGRAVYVLDGHADTLGGTEANMELSRRRTLAVAEALVREGVAWEQIRMESYGETRLARPTPDGTSEPLNRRVWIDVRYPRPSTSD